MMLTPGSERDSMWSMPGASVKKRSWREVMSFSTCSGGIPGKKVAVTTTVMSMEGNMSTGILARNDTPSTTMSSAQTMMKYGFRIENAAMALADSAELRFHLLSGAELAAIADDNQ